MRAYWLAVARHLGDAIFDVLFVAILSLTPLLLGRIVPLVLNQSQPGAYWEFLTNGQLAFFSMGSLATLLLLCFRKKLPNTGTLWIGFFSVICLLFLMVLVGVDPTLQKPITWVGQAALYLYGTVLLVRILAEAMKSVGASDALDAGTRAAKKTEQGLKERMSGGRA